MRYIAIILFILCINVAIGVVNTMDFLNAEQQENTQLTGQFKDAALQNAQYSGSQISDTATNFGFGDFLKAIGIFATTFAAGVVYVPSLLENFGITYPYSIYFSMPVYFIYLWGFVQFLANRAGKSMS